jgi:subfamily B ATP-binding cassette protein HlyB/CyaB
MLRCAKELKLKAHSVSESWAGLMRLPLPARGTPSSGSITALGSGLSCTH